MAKLNAAIFHWRNGLPVPVTLTIELATRGYDVPALEAKYLQ